jgi:flavin-binding protein dodecin
MLSGMAKDRLAISPRHSIQSCFCSRFAVRSAEGNAASLSRRPQGDGYRNAGRRLQDLICLRSRRAQEWRMSDHVYKKIELVGSSTTSIEDAVANALSRAQKTIRNMRWFEVVETRGHIEDGKINHWQVTVKVGFTLDK